MKNVNAILLVYQNLGYCRCGACGACPDSDFEKKFRYDVLNSPSFKFCGPLELENAYCCSNCGTAFGTAVFLDSVPKTRKLDKSTNRIYIDGLEPLHIAKKEEELLRSILESIDQIKLNLSNTSYGRDDAAVMQRLAGYMALYFDHGHGMRLCTKQNGVGSCSVSSCENRARSAPLHCYDR